MLPEIIYRKASEEFGVPVGVAKILGFKKKKEHIEEITTENYKKLSNELDINWIIADTVIDGTYKKLQREIYTLKRTNKRLKSELSIYNRAYKNINGESNTNNTKSGKIFSKG
jgi:predicted  nucleic acid-binding Zn-ribbon protein